MKQKEMIQLIRKKYKLLWGLLFILFVCYFILPILLVVDIDFLPSNKTVINIPFIWIYTFLLIPLTLFLGWLHHQIAKRFDNEISKLVKQRSS